jgi:glycosyltransferase involved in cell wall biosynthesis
MRILVSAIACSPYQGSEPGVGWKAVRAIAKDHHVHVLTHPRYRADLARAQEANLVPENVSFTFLGKERPWHGNRMLARLQSWSEYRAWIQESLGEARQLCREQSFDLAHHVTYATWRVGSPLWQLPIPFVWGPVGGVASMPRSMMGILSPQARLFERARGITTWTASRLPRLLNCVRRSSVIVASNRETHEFLTRLRGRTEGVELLSATFFTEEQVARFQSAAGLRAAAGPLRLFAGGNLIGTKGVALALQALALAKRQGLAFHYTVAGGGPEVGHLKALARQLGLETDVEFHPGFKGDAYLRALGTSHVFFMPSFRENAPVTIMEAMLAGCVPVVADWSAQGEVVTEECGLKSAPSNPHRMAEEFGGALLSLDRQRDRIDVFSRRSQGRIQSKYSESHYRACLAKVYGFALELRDSKAATFTRKS